MQEVQTQMSWKASAELLGGLTRMAGLASGLLVLSNAGMLERHDHGKVN